MFDDLEVIYEKCLPDQVDQLLEEDRYLKDYNHILDKELKDLDLLDLRKLKYADFDKLSIEELEKIIDKLEFLKGYHKTTELNKKVLRNGIYGACGAYSYHFYNLNLAADITAEARNMIRIVKMLVNDVFNGKTKIPKNILRELGIKKINYPKNPINYIIYGDTDSNYIDVGSFIETIEFVDGSEYIENGIKFVLDFDDLFLNNHIQNYIFDYVKSRNGVSTIIYENEKICNAGVFPDKKKHYAISVVWSDGKYLSEPDIIKVGYDKSVLPKGARKFLSRNFKFLLQPKEITLGEYRKHMSEIKKEFSKVPLGSKCRMTAIKTYNDYVLEDRTSLKFAPRASKAIKGAAAFNYYIHKNGLGGYYERLGHNDRVAYYETKTSFYQGVFSFDPSKPLPKFAPEVDDDAQFKDLIINPIENILKVSGFERHSKHGTQRQSFAELF